MSKDKILNDWNEQFSSINKLTISDVKEIYKKINKTNNPELKKVYYDKIILGTQHVIYKYLKSTNLYLLSSVEIGTEDIIDSVYEVWIKNVKSGKLNEVDSFSKVIQSNSFSGSIVNNFGFNSQFDINSGGIDSSTFYEFGKLHSDNALESLNDSDLKKYFIRYYRLNQEFNGNNDKVKEVFEIDNISHNQKATIISFFEKMNDYLESTIGNKKISNTNLEKYIKLITCNMISSNFVDNHELLDERKFDSEIMQNDARESLLNLFQEASLSEREKFVIGNRYGLADGRCKTYKEIGNLSKSNGIQAMETEVKALRKLKRVKNKRCLSDFI